jgi:hypothetical protein
MKVIRHKNEDDEFRCISFSNTLISRRGIVRKLKEIPGFVKSEYQPDIKESDFYRFEINGLEFTVTEPWGDSSQYEIFCETPNTAELEDIAVFLEGINYDLLGILKWVLIGVPIIYLFVEWYT